MPKCKYGLACRIITPEMEMSTKLPKEQQHWFKFQHPCFWCLKEGHPELGPPGCLCPLDPKQYKAKPHLAKLIIPCTNMDADHRRCFRHPEDDEVVEEVVDEAPDELDEAVITSEEAWTPPTFGDVSEDDGMEAKMAAAEAAAEGLPSLSSASARFAYVSADGAAASALL